MSTPYRIVLCTCPDTDSAGHLARCLVEQRLAACVHVIPGLTSVYGWQGKVESNHEVLMLAKTRVDRMDALEDFIRLHHPYELPEIVAVSIEQGNPAYLKWLSAWVDPSV